MALGDNDGGNWGSFQIFFQGWLVRQQHYLEQLLSTTYHDHDNNKPEEEEEELINALVSQVLSHYQQYYEAKSVMIRQDVYIVFTPPWFSSYERTFLWIAGFKPGLAFKLMRNSVRDLSEGQKVRVRELMVETKTAERELNDEMCRVQESVAARTVVDMAGITQSLIIDHGNDGDDVEAAGIRRLREAMESLVEGADFVRMSTARKVVEILSPVQAVRFLAAATQLQLKIRAWGSQRDDELRRRRRTTTATTTTTRRT